MLAARSGHVYINRYRSETNGSNCRDMGARMTQRKPSVKPTNTLWQGLKRAQGIYKAGMKSGKWRRTQITFLSLHTSCKCTVRSWVWREDERDGELWRLCGWERHCVDAPVQGPCSQFPTWQSGAAPRLPSFCFLYLTIFLGIPQSPRDELLTWAFFQKRWNLCKALLLDQTISLKKKTPLWCNEVLRPAA